MSDIKNSIDRLQGELCKAISNYSILISHDLIFSLLYGRHIELIYDFAMQIMYLHHNIKLLEANTFWDCKFLKEVDTSNIEAFLKALKGKESNLHLCKSLDSYGCYSSSYESCYGVIFNDRRIEEGLKEFFGTIDTLFSILDEQKPYFGGIWSEFHNAMGHILQAVIINEKCKRGLEDKESLQKAKEHNIESARNHFYRSSKDVYKIIIRSVMKSINSLKEKYWDKYKKVRCAEFDAIGRRDSIELKNLAEELVEEINKDKNFKKQASDCMQGEISYLEKIVVREDTRCILRYKDGDNSFLEVFFVSEQEKITYGYIKGERAKEGWKKLRAKRDADFFEGVNKVFKNELKKPR